MVIDKIKNFEDYNNYPGEPGATTDAEMQDYMKNQNDTLQALGKRLWQPEANYKIGNIIHSPNMPANFKAKCVVQGKSGSSEPSWTAVAGNRVVDGTTFWLMVKEVNIASVDGVEPAEDGTVITPLMRGATSSQAGKGGRVPAPGPGKNNMAFFGDGTYKNAIQTINGTGPNEKGDINITDITGNAATASGLKDRESGTKITAAYSGSTQSTSSRYACVWDSYHIGFLSWANVLTKLGLKRYVTETYTSGNSWWEKYNDGWVRQGSYVGSSGQSTYISLLLPMATTSYSIRVTGCKYGYDAASPVVGSVSKTGFYIYQGVGISGDYWETEGQGA